MLHITNGVVTLTVTSGAFKTYFSSRGFTVLDATEKPEEDGVGNYHPSSEQTEDEEISQEKEDYSPDDEESEDTDDSDDEESEDFSEIPLGEMDFDTLCRYADQLGLRRDKIRSKRELRQLIREHLKK